MRTYPFHHILVVVRQKSIRQSHHRYSLVFNAIRSSAFGAGEMYVVEVVATFASAHAVFANS